jgi:hypothetical protein
VTSLHRVALIINCGSCRGTAYGVALPTLSCHDGIRHFGEEGAKHRLYIPYQLSE